jgi:DNA-binding transcriptional MerR regulator
MTIAEVSKRFDISIDTLRYYERIGLIPDVRRTSSGIRDYSEGDCNWVGFVKCMRDAGISVDSLNEYVSLFKKGEAAKDKRRQILITQRDDIVRRAAELQGIIEKLNYKIEHYDDTIIPAERKLIWLE